MICYFPQKRLSDPMNQIHAQSVRVYEYGKDMRKNPKLRKSSTLQHKTDCWEHVAGVRVICHINFYTINTKEKECQTNEQAN